MPLEHPSSREPVLLACLSIVGLTLSGMGPHDRVTWWLEAAPVMIVLFLCALTYTRFPLSLLLYRLLFVHGLILMLGAHYTYARVPAGFWFQEVFDLSRNHYDRLGHLAQGFVPAILAREILLRRSPLVRGRWLFFLGTSVCLAFSALYELIEWWAAVLGGDSADSFLGTQGDIWDTQWDMFLALVGAIAAPLLLSRLHDRSLVRIGVPPSDR